MKSSNILIFCSVRLGKPNIGLRFMHAKGGQSDEKKLQVQIPQYNNVLELGKFRNQIDGGGG